MGISSPCRFVGRQADDAKVNRRHSSRKLGILINLDTKIGFKRRTVLYNGEATQEENEYMPYIDLGNVDE